MPLNIRRSAIHERRFLMHNLSRQEVADGMNAMTAYPKKFRDSIQRIVNEIGAAPETAFAMMLMTSALMDLRPEDEQVVHIILQDCGIEDGDVA